jgi:hypothetical protein
VLLTILYFYRVPICASAKNNIQISIYILLSFAPHTYINVFDRKIPEMDNCAEQGQIQFESHPFPST